MVRVKLKNKTPFTQDGYLNNLLKGLKNVVLTKNTSAVIITDGKSGKGKTTISVQMLSVLDNNFNINKIFFEPEPFLQALANAKKGDGFLFDEAMLFSSRSSLTEINRMMIHALSMIRSKQIFIVFAINSCFDLDKNIILHRADLLINVYGKNLGDRGHFMSFFKPKDSSTDRIKLLYLHGKKFYSYSYPRSNFHGSFPKTFLVNEALYEKKKQEAIDKILTKSSLDIPRRDRYLANAIHYLKINDNLTATSISKICDCTHPTILNILKKYIDKNEKGGKTKYGNKKTT